ncbi:MAG: hypothetical protein AAF383_23580 [Cyanobacteria bacterium P01_A01_bin.83]
MMNTKLIWRLLASIVTVSSLTANQLPGKEPVDDSEYLYCCQDNPYGGGRDRNYRWYNSQEIEIDGEIIRLDSP